MDFTRSKEIIQWCPECHRLADAQQKLEFANAMLVADISICKECGRILWDWHWIPAPAVVETPKPKPAKQMKLF